MMIIDVRKLNAGKTYSGRLEFEYMAPESLIDIPFVRFSAPVKVEAEFELYEDDSFGAEGESELWPRGTMLEVFERGLRAGRRGDRCLFPAFRGRRGLFLFERNYPS